MPKFQKGDIIEASQKYIHNGILRNYKKRAKVVGVSSTKYTLEYFDYPSRSLEYFDRIDEHYVIPKEYDNPLWRKLEGKD